MRIAEISTLSRPVPPAGEGSVESLVWTLTEGLTARGHDVTLFATADSQTSAKLRSPVDASYTADSSKWDWQLYEAFQAREAFRAWRDFDIIHCHSYHFGMLFSDFAPIPSLHSVHIEPGPDYLFLAQRTSNCHLQFASRYQARDFPDSERVHIIPHGIDMSMFHVWPQDQRQDYLAFLGRFIPEKGPLEAISIAKRAGLPIKLAGPHNDYFQQELAPLVDGINVEYVGEVHGRAKADFLAGARALIYPVRRGEPFGLVLVEAMASGVPVLAFNNGAVPEIIRHGETGWISDDMDELAEAAANIKQFDCCAIRRHAEARYSSSIMIDNVESLLQKMVEEHRDDSRYPSA